jgi:transposase
MASKTRSAPRSSPSSSRPRRDRAALEARRRTAAALFAEQVPQAEVARRLKVSRESVSQWHQQWRQGGVEALQRADRADRPPRLTAEQLGEVEKALLAGAPANGYPTELWTLRRRGSEAAIPSRRRHRRSHASARYGGGAHQPAASTLRGQPGGCPKQAEHKAGDAVRIRHEVTQAAPVDHRRRPVSPLPSSGPWYGRPTL